MRTRLVFGVLLLTSAAQAASDFQSWTGVFLNQEFTPRWLGFAEVQNRMWRDSSTERQLLVRVAGGIRIGKSHSLWVGYGYTPLFSPTYIGEQRLWQQSLADYYWDHWRLSFRFRLEERFLDGGGSVAWR